MINLQVEWVIHVAEEIVDSVLMIHDDEMYISFCEIYVQDVIFQVSSEGHPLDDHYSLKVVLECHSDCF